MNFKFTSPNPTRVSARRAEDLRTIDPWSIRGKAMARAERLGFAVPTKLPLLEHPLHERSDKELVDRLIIAFASASLESGLDRAIILEFLKTESIEAKSLSDSTQPGISAKEAECLGWCLGLGASSDCTEPADLKFMSPLLEFGRDPDAVRLRSRVRRRLPSACFLQLDIATCIRAAMQNSTRPKQVELVKAQLDVLSWVFEFPTA